jgi:hypothetical protein
MWKRVVAGTGVTLLIVLAAVIGGFLLFGGQLPESKGAPAVGEKAPEFALPDTKNATVKLSELLAGTQGEAKPNGVLLVFYRGYW